MLLVMKEIIENTRIDEHLSSQSNRSVVKIANVWDNFTRYQTITELCQIIQPYLFSRRSKKVPKSG